MASPDFSEYVDLTIFDEDPNTLFDVAIEYARTVLPEWVPEAGNIEVVLIEAIATEAANVIQAINRVPGAVTETLLKLFGVERSDGTAATATLQVIAINSNGYTILQGSPFAYFPPDGSEPLVYTTDQDLVIPNGSISGTVAITAQEVGTNYNEPGGGSPLQLLENAPYVQSASLIGSPTGGTEAESDDVFFQRAINTLRSYSAALTTASQIEAFVLVNYSDNIYRAHVFDKSRAADRDTTAAGYVDQAHTGYSLVAIAGQNSDPNDTSDTTISADLRQEIQDDLTARVNPGLITEVVNAEIVDVGVQVTLKKLAGFTGEQVQTAVRAALVDYLSSNNWNWDRKVRVNELISLIDGVTGVDYVETIDGITTTSANASGGGAGQDLNLHILGSLTTPDVSQFLITVSS